LQEAEQILEKIDHLHQEFARRAAVSRVLITIGGNTARLWWHRYNRSASNSPCSVERTNFLYSCLFSEFLLGDNLFAFYVH